MPIRIDNQLPARLSLELENIFVMTEARANHQDIRPLRILILNLMPTKIETETQLLRVLSNSPLQVEVELLQTASYISKNTNAEHLFKFYKTFPDVKNARFDGMILTGAPVELLDFEKVDYWPELCEILEWARTHVYSTFAICWGAQAGLYYYYGIPKHTLPQKRSGVFAHRALEPNHPLLRGLDDCFQVPHSRYTETRAADVLLVPALRILSASDEAGVHIVADQDCRRIFVTGHSEYDRGTLAGEYFRDLARDPANTRLPQHYFPEDDVERVPPLCWRGAANQIFCNWLNYFVYQRTPYDLKKLDG